jgi:hypothetical protein
MFNVWSFVYGYMLIVEKEFNGTRDECSDWIAKNELDSDPVQYRIVPKHIHNKSDAIEWMGLRVD